MNPAAHNHRDKSEFNEKKNRQKEKKQRKFGEF